MIVLAFFAVLECCLYVLLIWAGQAYLPDHELAEHRGIMLLFLFLAGLNLGEALALLQGVM